MAKYLSNRVRNFNIGVSSITESDTVLTAIGNTDFTGKVDIDIGSGTTAFEIQGSAGQLFSVTNNLTSGSIFSVNDVSGIPSIDVDADGTILLAPYGVTEFVGVGTNNPAEKLDVVGTVKATTFSGSGANLTNLTGASAATYGDASNVAQIVVDSNGRITSITEVSITGGGGGGGGGLAGDKIEEGDTKAEVIDTGTDGRFIVETDGVERLFIDSDKFEISDGTTPLFLVNDNVSDGNIFELNKSNGDLAFSVDATTGNVAIGEIEATSKLHVDGDVTINGNFSADNFNTDGIRLEALGIGIDADPDIPLQIYNETTSTALFSVNDNVTDGIIFGINDVNSSSLFSVDADGTILFRTSGNIGIGTTLVEPTAKLHVDGDVTIEGDVTIDGGDLIVSTTTFNLANTNVTTVNAFGAATTVNFAGAATTVNFAGAGIDIQIGAATGTTNVNNNLDVDGDVNIDGGDLTVSTAAFNLATSTATTVNAFSAATTIGIGAATGTTTVNNDLAVTGNITAANLSSTDVDYETGKFGAIGIGIDADPDIPLQVFNGTTSLFLVNDNVSDGNIFELNKSDGDLAFGVDATTGNVSIGGVESTSKLHVDGDVTITGDINAANFNTDGIRLEALGIGIDADPDIPLQIYNETTSTALFSVNDNVSDGIIFGINNINSSSLFSVDADGTILFRTSGNVGIGTTLVEPTAKLHVDGTVNATSFVKSGGTSSQFLMADGSTSGGISPVMMGMIF